ncbi:basic proline-rich protein-like [Erinaceus europaeus]|uniref:Basic proline-rich protein-like n=1 Tax=Erinaceus europaeus TaxID=9365 RepID=A0ABM3WV27_ERIEU|nr:basic proline-rich protein-like [Erinaceus europaeus]
MRARRLPCGRGGRGARADTPPGPRAPPPPPPPPTFPGPRPCAPRSPAAGAAIASPAPSSARTRPRTPRIPPSSARTRPRTPRIPPSSARTRPRTPRIPPSSVRTRPRTPRIPPSSARTRPRTPRIPLSSARTRPRTPRIPLSSARTRPRTPRFPSRAHPPPRAPRAPGPGLPAPARRRPRPPPPPPRAPRVPPPPGSNLPRVAQRGGADRGGGAPSRPAAAPQTRACAPPQRGRAHAGSPGPRLMESRPGRAEGAVRCGGSGLCGAGGRGAAPRLRPQRPPRVPGGFAWRPLERALSAGRRGLRDTDPGGGGPGELGVPSPGLWLSLPPPPHPLTRWEHMGGPPPRWSAPAAPTTTAGRREGTSPEKVPAAPRTAFEGGCKTARAPWAPNTGHEPGCGDAASSCPQADRQTDSGGRVHPDPTFHAQDVESDRAGPCFRAGGEQGHSFFCFVGGLWLFFVFHVEKVEEAWTSLEKRPGMLAAAPARPHTPGPALEEAPAAGSPIPKYVWKPGRRPPALGPAQPWNVCAGAEAPSPGGLTTQGLRAGCVLQATVHAGTGPPKLAKGRGLPSAPPRNGPRRPSEQPPRSPGPTRDARDARMQGRPSNRRARMQGASSNHRDPSSHWSRGALRLTPYWPRYGHMATSSTKDAGKCSLSGQPMEGFQIWAPLPTGAVSV